jgi:hypothetical protein
MSRILPNPAVILRVALAAAATSLVASTLAAQAALGTPFIGANNLSFRASELTKSGGAETTTVFGVHYGHRFSGSGPTSIAMLLRGSARAFDDVQAGVLDVGANVAVSREIRSVRGLSLAASTGLGVMAWGNDANRTGRLHVTIPANAGVSYDLRVRGATLSPFVMGSVSRYDIRTSLDDARDSVDDGWDTTYTTGMSLRFRDIVLTTSSMHGEYGMPKRSRWGFSAGVSF